MLLILMFKWIVKMAKAMERRTRENKKGRATKWETSLVVVDCVLMIVILIITGNSLTV